MDIDGDGVTEIIAGTSIYAPEDLAEDRWTRHEFAHGYVQTRVVVADLIGADTPQIVLVEGESDEGRLALFSAPNWEPAVLREGLYHPHSLEIADFDGDGLPEIFVAEMGLGANPHEPLMLLFSNVGGDFDEHVIGVGVPTHEAKVADMTGNGRPDIVGKPYDPERHINLWINET